MHQKVPLILTEIRFRPEVFAPWSLYQGFALDPMGA